MNLLLSFVEVMVGKKMSWRDLKHPKTPQRNHSGRPCILQCKVKYMLGQLNGPRSSWVEGSARSLNHCIVGTFQANIICCFSRMKREKILHSSAAWLESKVGTLFL